ncbi:ABC transporter permease [Sutcliffiella cohnii]|uniref:ABC transporter permease n=1 Tax=Sutcliffiella cohnii TaxID=33932 RepID=UPI002E2035FB|nr:ABC transporter permease [Sutcliffiella cohnii]
MTFSQLVWKMAKVNSRKYIFYYLCNSFAVLFFFMFSTVYFNDQVVAVKELESIQDALIIPAVALVVFTVFFISNAHTVFMKSRRKEFGLFITLGMSNRDISKLLLVENGVIGFVSIFSGIVGGAVFSKLFFLLLMNSVGIQGVSFHINSNMFLYSICAFMLVFLFSVGKSLIQILYFNLMDSLKSDKVAETIKMKSPLLGGIGLMVVVGSILLLYFTYATAGDAGGLLLLWTIILLAGLYMCLNQFFSFYIDIAKRNKSYFYRRLLVLTSLDYKFKQLTSLLMLITVMVMVTIFYSTLLLFFYTSVEKQVKEHSPFDIAYIQTETKNNISVHDLYTILDQEEHRITQHLDIPIFNYFQEHPYWEGVHYIYTFMSLEEFNTLTSSQGKLQDGEYFYYINSVPEYAYSNSDYDQGLTFQIGNNQLTYHLKDTKVERQINYLSYVNDIIVVNESDYHFLKNNLDTYSANLQLINMNNWKNSIDAAKELEDTLRINNASIPPIEDFRTIYTLEEDLLQLSAKVFDYNREKHTNGIMFFVTIFLSVIFFFGTFILLYLHLFSDIEKEKVKYKKLYKIGITVKEVKKVISQELSFLFFLPTILGATIAYLYIMILATDIGGIMENPSLLVNFFIIASIYHAIQFSYFFYARRKMVVKIMD